MLSTFLPFLWLLRIQSRKVSKQTVMTEVAMASASSGLLLDGGYPQPPSSISPASSRRESLRPAHLESGSEPPTPASPLPHLTRKRVASLDTNVANNSRLEDFALTSASTINGVSGGVKICLCQPDPKIPRPRNGALRDPYPLCYLTLPAAGLFILFVPSFLSYLQYCY